MATEGKENKREMCRRCSRPRERTCICSSLPPVPIVLKNCHCVVLQHPLELKRKNRSLPFLQLSLDPSCLNVIVSRSVLDAMDVCPSLAPLYVESSGSHHGHIWLIYPDPEAIPLSKALQSWWSDQEASTATKLTVVFFDATWQYAQEMNRANRQYFSDVRRVQLDDDDFDRIVDPDRFAMRRPPSPRHLSTGECAAYCLSRVEGRHPQLYDELLAPLDLAMRQWRTFVQVPKRPLK